MAKDPEQPLTPAQLGPLRAQLAVASGRRRLDLILDAPDPGALVRALPADELYFTIREIGLADAVELVQLASAEQFRTFLDLDAWRQGRFEPRRALPWLRAARTGAQQDTRLATRLARKMRTLDAELVDLVLRDAIRVHDLRANDDPDVEADQVMRTPDNEYLVEFLVEGSEYVAVRGLLDDIEAEDPFKLSRLLAAITWELPSELEETALRWRQGRLADLGYPSLEEALSWYARPPARPAEAPGQPRRAPGFFLAPLARALAAGPRRQHASTPPTARRSTCSWSPPATPCWWPTASTRSTSTRSAPRWPAPAPWWSWGWSGWRAATRPAPPRSLAATPVKRLFQEGFGRVLELSWRADRLFKAGAAGRRTTPLLDAPLGELLAALSSRRPRFHPGIERPREEWGTPALAALEPRRFLTAADLSLTAAALDLCEGLAALARELELVPAQAEGEAPRLSALYLTALANQRLGRRFEPAPIPAGDLPAVAARAGADRGSAARQPRRGGDAPAGAGPPTGRRAGRPPSTGPWPRPSW